METLNTKGYYLSMVKANEWFYDDKSGQTFTGSFYSVVKYALRRGFDIAEIELGVKEMLKYDHDTIHFGMYKKFMFTVNSKREAA